MRFHPFIKLALSPDLEADRARVSLSAPADLSTTLGTSMPGAPTTQTDYGPLGGQMLGSGVVQMGRQPGQLGDIPPSLQQPFVPFMPDLGTPAGNPVNGNVSTKPTHNVGVGATGLSTQDARSSGGGQPFTSAGLTAPHTAVAPPPRTDMRPDIDPNMRPEDRQRLFTPIDKQPTELHTNKVDGGAIIDGKYGTGTSAPIGSQGFKDYARYNDPNRPAGAMPKNMGPASQYAGLSAPPQTGPAQPGPAQLATNQPTPQAFAQDAFKAAPRAMNVSQSAAKPAVQPVATPKPAVPAAPAGGLGPFTDPGRAQLAVQYGKKPAIPSAGFTPPPGGGVPFPNSALKPPASTTPSIKPTPGAAPMKVNHTMS